MSSNKDKFFLGLLTPIIYVYIFGIIIFTPYYSWKYAKEHGFVKWILFGGIIPTLKGAAWPYSLYANFKSRSTSRCLT